MNKGSLCRCCLAQPPDKKLKTIYTRLGKAEIYGDMLKECFEIHLPMGNSVCDDGICDECVSRLCNAADFKEQVLRCQKKFQTTLTKLNIKDEIDDTLVKIEYSDIKNGSEDIVFDFKEEFLDDELIKDEVITKVICIEDIKVKKTEKRNRKNILEDCIKDTCRRIPLSKIKSKAQVNLNCDKKKHEFNLSNILKYSNCLPFSNKTIMGIVCAFCKNIYREINELRIHYIEIHKNTTDNKLKKLGKGEFTLKIDITELKCALCDVQLEYISDLKKHLVSTHDINFYPNINDCIYEFKLDTSNVYNCALCNSTYETFKTLQHHMNSHYRNYICNICDMGYINNYALKIHKKTHEIGAYQCKHCDKIFNTLVKKKCHEKYIHNNSARYVTNCPNCELSFTSYYQRNRHIFTVHKTSNYKCNICDKTFILKSKLTAHIKKMHLMEREHICAVCGKGFFLKQLLNEHMVTHNGAKIFKCALCEKSYARKKTLTEHMRIHNNDRRFKCGLCNLAFVQKCSLKSHMLSNHGLTLMEFENNQSGITDL